MTACLQEKEELIDWWLKYNAKLKFEELPVSKKLRQELASVKENLRKQGFIYTRLFVGMKRNRVTHETRYKHLVIFKATNWTAVEGVRLTSFFKRNIPERDLEIYVIHGKKLMVYRGGSFALRRSMLMRRAVKL